MNLFKNKFLLIMLLSVATLFGLVIGGFVMYKDTSSAFSHEGYIIETTTKANKKYYFSANTKYKDNVDKKISFSDKDKKKVSVDPASFVHYMNGDVSFLQKGALVNLSELSNPMVTYYNITDENTIVSEKDGYTVSSNGKKITIESFVGRISDKKYLVAGNNLTLKVPKVDERIPGDYFEILYIEDGIVKIDNREASYQVTAQDSYIYVGDNITINLGDGKIFYSGEPKMLLSQITINGDENIDLDVEKDKDKEGAGGTGSGEGSGEGDGAEGTEGTEGTETGENGDTTEEGQAGNGLVDGNGGGSSDGSKTTASPQIELIEAKVTATSIDLSLQLNNSSLVKGDLVYYLTNVMTGERVDGKSIELANGTFKIMKESLAPSTEYALSIGELGSDDGRQYFQKVFKTSDLGISLEKNYATDSSLSYKVNFSENTEVTKVRLSIYDSNGKNDDIEVNQLFVSRDDLQNGVVFENLKSNTSYSVSLDMVWINNAAYSDVYSINRIDTTLKKTPTLSGIDIETNSEEIKFTIKLKKVSDPDKAIVNYVYNIYKADDITLDNNNPEVVYSVTKADSDALVLNLKEIPELKGGVDYRTKIVAQYDDNEMIREVSTDYSGNFLIKSKPSIVFESTSIVMNKVTGTFTLVDAGCTVPINGRSCLNGKNNFTIKYYKLKDGESKSNSIDDFSFLPSTLTTGDIVFENLSSNTTYAVKLYGDYIDDTGNRHSNVQIGDIMYFTTDKTEDLQFVVTGDNKSGNKIPREYPLPPIEHVVTFNANLSVPHEKRDEVLNAITSIKLNLYSGKYNTKDKLIGSYIITNRSEIEDFFNNYTITNDLFDDVTRNRLGKIDTVDKMEILTNNLTNTLNSDYTVEVEGVYYSNDTEKFFVEDNVYTFHLTSDYYLDTRIEQAEKKFIAVTEIKKEELTEEEYSELSRKISNLDDLDNSTVVGVRLENTLSDTFVDSAYEYEKAVVQYTIKNLATGSSISTPNLSIDMGNKYQPKELVVYLDPSELDDGNHFTRGYKYEFSYAIHFTVEDGSNPVYSNEALSVENNKIVRQSPLYTYYISTSNENSITYKYTFNDIDNAAADNNLYYKVGSEGDYQALNNALVADNQEHEVVIPVSERDIVDFVYAEKTLLNTVEQHTIHKYNFEKVYSYDNAVSFSIIKDNDNALKLKLENNDITSRAIAYRVDIETNDGSDISPYKHFFIASRLSALSIPNGEVDENDVPLVDTYKYIAIDYANISRFMKHEMTISVTAYFDSGLVGINQDLSSGFILKYRDENSNTTGYLNAYVNEASGQMVVNTEIDNKIKLSEPLGFYYLKSPFNGFGSELSLYNYLRGISNYNPFSGSGWDENKKSVEFEVSALNSGLTLTRGRVSYSGFNPKVLKEANLKTDNNKAKFDSIVPTVTVSANPTINSIKLNMTAKGIYGHSQFVKDGHEHPKIYIDFYSDEELHNKLNTLVADVNISGSDASGYSATIDSVEEVNLNPSTTYYYTLYAYIDGEYRQLYDGITGTSYVTKTYATSTRGPKEILESITFEVRPVAYAGESSKKRLTWKLVLKDTNNYRVRFELYAPSSTDGGESFKAVNFDGSDATSCNVSSNGNASNGYVNNCYISVDKVDVASINNVNQIYEFTGDNFVFGDGYYKLVVYAVPFTNGNYVEDQKVVLFQSDALSSSSVNLSQIISVYPLKAPEFSLRQEMEESSSETNPYVYFSSVVSDITTVNEKHYYVMKRGQYYITLLDNSPMRDPIQSCKISLNGGTPRTYSPCRVLTDLINPTVKITNISGESTYGNTKYFVDFTYETYMNNVGLSEREKIQPANNQIEIYSTMRSSVFVGNNITASRIDDKTVSFAFNKSYGLNKIGAINYTISLADVVGSSTVVGQYSLFTANVGGIEFKKNVDHLFETSMLNNDPNNFVINLADNVDNTSFTFKSNVKYRVRLQYYDMSGSLLGGSEVGF